MCETTADFFGLEGYTADRRLSVADSFKNPTDLYDSFIAET